MLLSFMNKDILILKELFSLMSWFILLSTLIASSILYVLNPYTDEPCQLISSSSPDYEPDWTVTNTPGSFGGDSTSVVTLQ